MRTMLCSALVLGALTTAALAEPLPAAGADPVGRTDTAEAAARRVERFFAYLEDDQIERAVDYLSGNHPGWSEDKRRFLTGRMRELVRLHGPITGFDEIGIQEFGPYLVRLNYLARMETTGAAFAIMMFNYRGDWILENFCYTDDLDDATESGPGILVCPVE